MLCLNHYGTEDTFDQLTQCSSHTPFQQGLPFKSPSKRTLCLLMSSLKLALPMPVLVVKDEEEGFEEATTMLRMLLPIEDLIIPITVQRRRKTSILAMVLRTIESLLNRSLQPSLQLPDPRLTVTLMFVGYALNLSSIILYRNVTIEPAMSVPLDLGLCIKRQTVRFAR